MSESAVWVHVTKPDCLERPDGKKKAYVRLTSDHDALDVANKVWDPFSLSLAIIQANYRRSDSSKSYPFPRTWRDSLAAALGLRSLHVLRRLSLLLVTVALHYFNTLCMHNVHATKSSTQATVRYSDIV